MKCNPLRWLWGLFALLPLALLAIVSSRAGIEADLTARVKENLKRSGLTWAEVVFEGREARIGGRAADDGDPDKATQIAFDTWGVRTSTSAATLLERVERYEWLAERQGNVVRLAGHVPNDKVRAEILAAAKAALPNITVEDNMRLARGAPALDVWTGGITFGLKQLAQLKAGQVKLEQTSMTVTGEAATLPAYTSVKTALGSMPKGVQLKQDAITAPLVRPYTWSARFAGDQLVLGGHVPSQRDRESLLATAKSAHPRAKLVDEMQIGAGAPDGYMVAVAAAVTELAKLEEGRAELNDASLTVQGLAGDAAKADGARAGLKRIPGAIRLADQIRHREPPPPPPPAQVQAISPYRTSLFAGTGTVVLSGHVPSEPTREALIALAKQRFPNRAIVDQLQLGSGQPDGWDKCVATGFAAVQRLGNGRANITGNRLEVAGVTTVADIAQSLAADVRNAAGSECQTEVQVRLERDAAAEEAKAKAEAERLKAEADAKAKAEAERLRAEAEARQRADAERRRQPQVAAPAPPPPPPPAPRADPPPAPRVDPPPPPLVQSPAVQQRNEMLERCQQDLKAAASEGITFRRASAEIETRSFPTLNRLAEVAARCADAQIEIEGHTDSDGTPDRNQRLSDRRAQSVLDYLVKAGVPPSRMSAIGYGETRAIAPNDTADNKALNRRIEFTVK